MEIHDGKLLPPAHLRFSSRLRVIEVDVPEDAVVAAEPPPPYRPRDPALRRAQEMLGPGLCL